MAEEVGSLYYDLTLDDKKLRGQLNEAESHFKRFGNNVVSLGKTLAAGVAIGGAAAAAFGVSAVKAYSEAEAAVTQTNAVLKSTGGIAGVTQVQVSELATALQKVTKFSDEEIRSGENLLLTFTNIGKDIFPEATETMLNMSQALGQDLKGSAIQLGKALQDPILGVTALRRVGVNFSEAQQDVIKNLVATGKSAEAQKLILKELQVEFGGSARAAGQTFAGKLAILKNSMNDVQESIGLVIVNALQPFAVKLADVITKIDWERVIDNTQRVLNNFWRNSIVPAAKAIMEIYRAVANYLEPKLGALFNTLQDKVIPILSRLWNEVLKPLVPIFGVALVGAIGLVIDAINLLFTILTPIINWMLGNKEVVIGFAAAFGILALSMNFGSIVAAFNGAINSAIVMVNTMRLVTIPSALTSLGQFAAGFGPVGLAAVAAAALIVDAGNKAKKAWDDAKNAAVTASNINDATIRQLRDLSKSGTPEQQKRARQTLSKLAETNSFAKGVENFRGGLAYVHKGEVLANLPKGTDVIPKNEVNNMGANKTFTGDINVYGDSGVREFFNRVERDRQLEGMGLSPVRI